MFRRGSEVTWDMLRRASNWNLSGAIESLLLSVLSCLKGLIGSLLGVQCDLFESLQCNAMSIVTFHLKNYQISKKFL